MPIRVQTPDGMHEFPDGTTPDEIDAVLGAVPQPMASHDSEPSAAAGPPRDWTDTAADFLPAAGAIAGGVLGAGALSIPLAGLGAAGGEGWRRTIQGLRGRRPQAAHESVGDTVSGVGLAGAEGAASQALGLGANAALAGAGKGLMRLAVGSKAGVRAKFPTVDLENVMLREGLSPTSGAKLARLSGAANEATGATARAADAAGAAPIQPRESVSGLRPLFDKAVQGRFPEQASQIADEANTIRSRYRGGISLEDAQVAKREFARIGRTTLQGAADPRTASTTADAAGAISKGFTKAMRDRSPEVGAALTRSQELMAVSKALKGGPASHVGLRAILAAGAGAGRGYSEGDPLAGLGSAAATYMATSPRALGGAARAVATSAPVLSKAMQAALMSILGQESPQ